MRHSYDPHDWEYDNHPQRDVLRTRCVRLGDALLSQPSQFKGGRFKDTLLAHKYVFRQFTPPGHPFYAGNYRGSNYSILRDYIVRIKIDPKVGLEPKYVKGEMAAFDKQFLKAVDRFERQFQAAKTDTAALLVELVEVMGIFLVRFLTIHPYANGNGHMGRLLFMTMLGRLNIRPATWLIDDRPPYDDAIFAHRRGDTKPLSSVLLKCIIG